MNITRFVTLTSVVTRSNVFFSSYNRFASVCCCTNALTTGKTSIISLQKRQTSTCETKDIYKEESLLRRLVDKIPFLNFSKLRVAASGYLLYEGIADHINYIDLFEELELPDTFYSWFVITELYIWMLSVRVMAEGADGKCLRNGLVEAFWSDVAQRIKKLGVNSTAMMKQQVSELSEQLQAALLAYDEGLQTSDTVLASALWRRFYQSGDVNMEKIVKLVQYIRKQIILLDNMSKDQIFTKRFVPWESISK